MYNPDRGRAAAFQHGGYRSRECRSRVRGEQSWLKGKSTDEHGARLLGVGSLDTHHYHQGQSASLNLSQALGGFCCLQSNPGMLISRLVKKNGFLHSKQVSLLHGFSQILT